jgi:hypothetical protein
MLEVWRENKTSRTPDLEFCEINSPEFCWQAEAKILTEAQGVEVIDYHQY